MKSKGRPGSIARQAAFDERLQRGGNSGCGCEGGRHEVRKRGATPILRQIFSLYYSPRIVI